MIIIKPVKNIKCIIRFSRLKAQSINRTMQQATNKTEQKLIEYCSLLEFRTRAAIRTQQQAANKIGQQTEHISYERRSDHLPQTIWIQSIKCVWITSNVNHSWMLPLLCNSAFEQANSINSSTFLHKNRT